VQNDVAEIFGGVFGKKFLLKRSAMQLLDARWGFETTSTYPSPMQVKDIQLNSRLQYTPFPAMSGDLQQFSRVPMPQRRIYSSWLFDGLLKNV